MADKKIVLFHSNRSEVGLIRPVATALERRGFTVKLINLAVYVPILQPFNLGKVYAEAYMLLDERHCPERRADLVFTPFDRCEMIFATLAAHHLNIPIAQMHAGDISQGTWDDETRHAIALYATLHFCNGPAATEPVHALLDTIHKPTTHVYDVGSTAFDDVELDEGLVPTQPYSLIVYNVPTKRPDTIFDDLETIERTIEATGHHAIWILPSSVEDVAHATVITSTAMRLEATGRATVYDSLPRPKFLGLMKRCHCFLGNSSALFYEAPYFLKPEQIIHVGIRNLGREPIEIRPGGSERIADLVQAYLEAHADVA